jgi:hypothetical protein
MMGFPKIFGAVDKAAAAKPRQDSANE